MKKTIALLATASLSTALLGCTQSPTASEGRAPSSTAAPVVSAMIPKPQDLAAATRQFHAFLQSNRFTARNCPKVLQDVYERAYRIDGRTFDKEKTLRDFDEVMKNLWEAKLTLRKRMKEFLDQKQLSRECVDAARNILRAGRAMEDYVGYLKLKPAPFNPRRTLPAYEGGFPYLMVNADVNGIHFKSGDILLSRGTAFTSSAIARIGDVDGQFSHLAILYIDEKRKIHTVEAHIEIGVKTFTLEEYLKDGKARAVLFRYHDQELAHLAAKRMFELSQRVSASGENIPYDFTMTSTDPDQLYCSEVVQYGYEMAGKELGRTLKLPLFPTLISMRNRDFLNALGVKATETFAPADMEIDPRLELVAEWRDFSRVRMLHQHDAVLSKIYEWMEHHDYILQGDPLNWITKNLVWSMRRWPLFSELLKEKFPKNMSPSMIGAVSKLNTVAGGMFDELTRTDEQYLRETGMPMTPKNMADFLETLRERDLQAYREDRECRTSPANGEGGGCRNALPVFHWDFRARNEQ